MKKFLLIAAVLALSHTVATAQSGYLGIFGDAEATDCYPMDDYVGILRFYVVMIESEGFTGTEFSVVPGGGFVGVFMGDELSDQANISFGNSPTGKQIALGACRSGTVHVLTISYYCQGLSPTCSYLEVLPNPESIHPETVNIANCDYILANVPSGRTYVNHDETCSCEAPGYNTTPVQPSTWGGVKALYAQR